MPHSNKKQPPPQLTSYYSSINSLLSLMLKLDHTKEVIWLTPISNPGFSPKLQIHSPNNSPLQLHV
jgi:hypothetical protein